MRRVPLGQEVYLGASRAFLERLGSDGLGDEYDQSDYAIQGSEPRWLLFPGDDDECRAALEIAAKFGLAVVPAGLGGRLEQGSPRARTDAILSLRRRTGIVDHAVGDFTVTVEAGCPLDELARRLASERQMLGVDPLRPEQTTVGGLVATNTMGPSRLRYGSIRESILGARVLLSDGSIVRSGGRVVKNVSGYDLHRLLVGSFGTLAVVLDATFRLHPLPERSESIRVVGAPIERLLGFGAAFTRSSIGLLHAIVFREGDAPPRLEIGLSGNEIDVVAGGRQVEESLGRGHGFEIAARGSIDDVRERMTAIANPGGSAVVLRGGVRPRSLALWATRALPALDAAAERVDASIEAGVGVARFRLESPERESLASAIERVRSEAIAAGGYLVVESAPRGWLSGMAVWGPPHGSLALMRRVKAAFDPEQRLSPWRFVRGL